MRARKLSLQIGRSFLGVETGAPHRLFLLAVNVAFNNTLSLCGVLVGINLHN